MIYNNLDESCPKIKQPSGLKVVLKPHQLTAIYAMSELEENGSIIIDQPEPNDIIYHILKARLNDTVELSQSTFFLQTNSAILGDLVGSGKTYMIIGLIEHQQVPAVHERHIMGTDHFSIKMVTAKESEKVNLIIVPHNLINQWSEFLDNSSLDYLKLNLISDFDVFFDIDYVTEEEKRRNREKGDDVIYQVANAKAIKKIKKLRKKITGPFYERRKINNEKIREMLNTKGIFVLNVNRYRIFKQIFRSTRWARVIVDEMDSISIPQIFDEYGNFNWFVTATPRSIFYKSCRRYVHKIFGHSPPLLDYFVIKNKEEYVNQSMLVPHTEVFMIDTLLQPMISAIHQFIPPEAMNLINSGNMKEAIIKLNCNVDTEENIVKVLTKKLSTELHNLKTSLKLNQQLIVAPMEKEAHEKRLEKIKNDIVTCETKLQTIYERINSIKEECCFICAQKFDTPTILDCCKSVFCLKCLLPALKFAGNKCPYCRKVIQSNKEYHVIGTKDKQSKNKPSKFCNMDKCDVLEHLLCYIAKNYESPRILIFSDYSETFDKILKNIAKANLQYSFISGTASHISKVIEEFNNGVTNILLMNSQHYGSGLNLQAANFLILYHRMMPELEIQVIGRANRFGRKNKLKVIYLVNNSENRDTPLADSPTWIKSIKGLSNLGTESANDEEDDSASEEDEPIPKKKSKAGSKTNKKTKSCMKANKKSKLFSKKLKENGSDNDSSEDLSE